MGLLKRSLEEKNLDIRLVSRAQDKGFQAAEGYAQSVKNLEDDSTLASQVNLEADDSQEN